MKRTIAVGLTALWVALSIAACDDSSGGGSGGGSSGSGESCDLGRVHYMDYCDGGCGDVMQCVQFCASCDALCQVACTDDADCAAVGAGVCKHPESSGGQAVCTEAPTVCGGGTGDDGGDATTSDASSSASGGACIPDGATCEVHADCCSYGEGDGDCITQPSGLGQCVPFCTSNAECSTGCCRELVGGQSACAPASYC